MRWKCSRNLSRSWSCRSPRHKRRARRGHSPALRRFPTHCRPMPVGKSSPSSSAPCRRFPSHISGSSRGHRTARPARRSSRPRRRTERADLDRRGQRCRCRPNPRWRTTGRCPRRRSSSTHPADMIQTRIVRPPCMPFRSAGGCTPDRRPRRCTRLPHRPCLPRCDTVRADPVPPVRSCTRPCWTRERRTRRFQHRPSNSRRLGRRNPSRSQYRSNRHCRPVSVRSSRHCRYSENRNRRPSHTLSCSVQWCRR